MKTKDNKLLPVLTKILSEFGENLKLARLRRNITASMVAERAGISRFTLWQIEKGSPKVSFGAYSMVLFVLGLEKDLLNLAKDDILGRKLQDLQILPKKRSRR